MTEIEKFLGEDWSDIKPIPQDDGPSPICPIAYSPEYVKLMDLFRAILDKNEKSLRVLKLLDEVLESQPANYTAWHYRRRVIEEIDVSLYEKEFKFVEDICSESPKNYQLWYHRQVTVEKTNDTSREKNFIHSVIEQDSKNYHAWSYRQWLVKKYSLWEGELEYIEELLKEDIRNNSAWNHRFFVLENTNKIKTKRNSPNSDLNQLTDDEKSFVEQEILYSFEKIKKSPNNQSGWLYLKGIVDGRYNLFPSVKEKSIEFYQKIPFCSNVLSLLLDIYLFENNLVEAHKTCEELSKRCFEPQRKYWNFRKSQLEEKLKSSETTTTTPS